MREIKSADNRIQKGLALSGIFLLFLFLGSISIFFYSPIIKSHAESNSSSVDVKIDVGPVISLSTNTDELILDANINSFVSGVVNVDVTTNSQYGYTLTLEDADDDTNMVSINDDVADVLSSNFSGSKTSVTMDDNTWGYSIDNTNFYKIPAKGNLAYLAKTNSASSTNPDGYDRTPVYFGTKVGVITSGDYIDTVKFTAYVNGQDGEPIIPIPMQSFSCSSLENIGDTAYVIDTRDDNVYPVKKVVDGQCWMMKNLKIQDRPLTDEDSDLQPGTTYTVPASDISKFTGVWGEDIDAVYIDDIYGGYYTYYTAVAGSSGMGVLSGDAPSSICPKGWRLPTGNTSGDYNNLYNYFHSPVPLMNELKLETIGYIRINEVQYQGVIGNYWTAYVSGGSSAYYLTIGENSYGHGVYNIYNGSGIRCIARN